MEHREGRTLHVKQKAVDLDIDKVGPSESRGVLKKQGPRDMAPSDPYETLVQRTQNLLLSASFATWRDVWEKMRQIKSTAILIVGRD